MAHGKETPRQKMIGMMYLVLTALLALNVSKEVLDAFILVDEGLTKTTENFSQKNDNLYVDFEQALQVNPVKVQEWFDKSQEVRKRTQQLYDTMQYYKKLIVTTRDGQDAADSIAARNGQVSLSFVKSLDDNNVPGEIMIVKKGGERLRAALASHREYLLSLITDKETYASVIRSIESSLNTDNPVPKKESKGETESWESEHFENLPLASTITILSKMQSDIKNAESETLGYLYSQIDVGSFKFNKIDAVVIPVSNYIFRGQEYKAEVFLAAYDSTKAPEIILDNNTKLPVNAAGKGVYSQQASSLGTKKWGGTIILDQGSGQVIRRDFTEEYQVAEASVVISPTKMNVFYRGVENPLSIAVPGVPKENLQARISKGSIQRSGSEWIVKPAGGAEGEEVTVTVSATIDGQTRTMGSMPFRVKNVPDPVAYVAGRNQGVIDLGTLTKATGVVAELRNFDFDLKFNVTEFTISAVQSGGFTKTEVSNGDKWSRPQLEIISQLKSGQRLTFENIKAVGPDGRTISLNTIVFKIN